MIDKYIKEISKMVPSAFAKKGDTLYLFGKLDKENDFAIEPNILLPLVEEIKNRNVNSVCFIKKNGGLFSTLVECCTPNMLGFDITGDSEIEDEEFLHGQCGYAAVIALDEDQENEFVDKMFDNNVKLTLLGHVTKGELRIDDDKLGQISDFIE